MTTSYSPLGKNSNCKKGRQVAEQNRLRSVRKKIIDFEDVDLLDLAADVRLQDDARARSEILYNHLPRRI